jgi:hypothetical protein
MNIASLLLTGLTLVAQAPPESAGPPGRRIDLGGEATLFVPEGYRPREGVVDVVLHLHGAPKVIESALVDAKWPAVLIEFNRKGLSSVYSAPFADPKLFPRLLDGTLHALVEAKLAEAPKLGKVAVSSFSAGFGGVRELLKVPEHFERIDALILADSLYCGYEGDPAAKKLDPRLMAGFREFARKAASGSKTMVVTHSAQVPEGYGSTTETADDLIQTVGGKASPARVERGEGWVQVREFRKGGLVVLGFEGVGPEDHMRHLRRISTTWEIAKQLASKVFLPPSPPGRGPG